MIATLVAMTSSFSWLKRVTPGVKTGGFFYLALAKHLPIALHLAGILQPGHGLNGAAFLPAFAGALAIIIFPYIIFSNKKS